MVLNHYRSSKSDTGNILNPRHILIKNGVVVIYTCDIYDILVYNIDIYTVLIHTIERGLHDQVASAVRDQLGEDSGEVVADAAEGPQYGFVLLYVQAVDQTLDGYDT